MITRTPSHSHVTVLAATNLSGTIDFTDMITGGIITPSALETNTVIGFKVATDRTGPFVTLYDKTGALAKVVVDWVSSRAYPLPDELAGWPFFKLFTCDTNGAGIAQSADRVFEISMKA